MYKALNLRSSRVFEINVTINIHLDESMNEIF